ncbi:hypothetical protein G4V62_17325 [Bacillaceae bacterium SIJ1]|uniref:hypothetical protein n=1 Tax=Litoribacterium kuwaitense TaxID=1398745 RepID=UPI0013EC50EB|nr:hypothetical protein [Litoribacterium kuwaitense]NGP46619.1 hypothetical protein [Litoribacterium kuwaitense]
MFEYMYFPDNKLEYIPPVITMLIFMIGAVLVFRAFIRNSKKEEQRINKKYDLKEANDEDAQHKKQS